MKLNQYKQAVANFYDRRSAGYDDGARRKQICDRLLNYSQLDLGQTVLDIGTGTGKIAIDAANTVGSKGKVIGIDIAPEMLVRAKNKAHTAKLNHVEFQLIDAESLNYPSGYFDRILCANTFPWIENKLATLNLWHSQLKSNGRIAVHTPADTAYINTVTLKKVLARHGIAMEASNRIGSQQECIDLFRQAGFREIKIEIEQYGTYVDLESAKATWSWIVANPSVISLKLDRQKLARSSDRLSQIKAEFDAELETLNTETGIWDKITAWYILARKIEHGVETCATTEKSST